MAGGADRPLAAAVGGSDNVGTRDAGRGCAPIGWIDHQSEGRLVLVLEMRGMLRAGLVGRPPVGGSDNVGPRGVPERRLFRAQISTIFRCAVAFGGAPIRRWGPDDRSARPQRATAAVSRQAGAWIVISMLALSVDFGDVGGQREALQICILLL